MVKLIPQRLLHEVPHYLHQATHVRPHAFLPHGLPHLQRPREIAAADMDIDEAGEGVHAWHQAFLPELRWPAMPRMVKDVKVKNQLKEDESGHLQRVQTTVTVTTAIWGMGLAPLHCGQILEIFESQMHTRMLPER